MLNEKEVQHALVKRVLRHLDAGTTDSAAEPYRHPTWTYTDPALFEQERLKIFKENPQLVGFTPDLPQPGSFFTFDDLGVPVLLVRDNDGKVNAFLNACSHRGARLKEGCGKSNAISCPYHAWGSDLLPQAIRNFLSASLHHRPRRQRRSGRQDYGEVGSSWNFLLYWR